MKGMNRFLLGDAPLDRQLRIRDLHSQPEVCGRLRAMGLCENAVVRCITRGRGSVICEVCNARVGLNDLLANDIVVAELE